MRPPLWKAGRFALLAACAALLAFTPAGDGCEDDSQSLVPMTVDGEVLVEYPQRDENRNLLGTARVGGFTGGEVVVSDQFGELGASPVVDGAWEFRDRWRSTGFANGVIATFRGERSAPVDLHRNRRHWSFEPFIVAAPPTRAELFPNPTGQYTTIRFELDGTQGGTYDVVVEVSDALVDEQTETQHRVLLEAELAGGAHELTWDGRFDGELAPAGLYRITVDLPLQGATWSEFLELRPEP